MIEVRGLRQRFAKFFGDRNKGAARRAFGRGDGHGNPLVAAFADFGEDRDFAEERDVLAAGFFVAAAVAEDFDALAARRGEVAHVLNDAEDGHVHFLEHADAFAHDAERSFLRGGDDHAAVERDGLAKGELSVAGAGRKIDEEIIEFAPRHAEEKLLDGFDDHRSAPNYRRVAFNQETHAHQMHAVVGGRDDFLVGADGRFFVDAHHERYARAVNIAIEQADARTEMTKPARDVDRSGAFADAPFAAGHRNDVLNAGNLVLV